MKRTFLAILILVAVFPATSQDLHPLLASFGKKLELKDYKSLTGLKCYEITSMHVASKKGEISIYQDENKAIDQIEIRPTYLEKGQYTKNPLLGITTNMEFEACYGHLEKMAGTSDFSPKSHDRSITFYYSPESSSERFYFIIHLGRDEDRILNVHSMTIRKSN